MELNMVAETLEEVKRDLCNLLPEYLAKELYEKSYISGGAIYSLYNNQKPKDYDFFLKEDEIGKKLRFHIRRNVALKYKNGVMIGKYKGENIIMTDNAISIGDCQIITKFVGSPEEVVGQFDFKHNQYYLEDGKIKALDGWKYIKGNKLYYNDQRARDICGTIIRVKKFVERGFTITNSEMAKMLLKLSKVGFNEREIEILESQDRRNNFES